jgi:hypothetical protein
MRRAGRIVNEMEFRMLREAKSFSPPARVDTMKGFSPMRRLAIPRRDSIICIILAHLRLRAPGFLESTGLLKRPCSSRAQYGWPFH